MAFIYLQLISTVLEHTVGLFIRVPPHILKKADTVLNVRDYVSTKKKKISNTINKIEYNAI